ncbi:MAG: 5-formyltetrahydrofolate cyclo-ligase [Acidimicrobiia bacterium]
MADYPPPGAGKAEWRAWARRIRSSLDVAEISRQIVVHLQSWKELRTAHTVLSFVPMPDEPDLTVLADRTDARFVVTRMTEGDGPLTLHPLDAPMERHRFGFSQPVVGTPVVDAAEVDVALVPGLVFDRRGVRLGRGMAYFDALLASLRDDARRVGVTPAALVVPEVPEAPHDVRMTDLVTEEGVRVADVAP